MIHSRIPKQQSRRLFNGTILAVTTLALALFMTLPGNTARAVHAQEYAIDALPEMCMGAAVCLDGRTLGVCGSIEAAQEAVELAVGELGMDGAESSVAGELTIVPELCVREDCLSAQELLAVLTGDDPLPVESLIVREYTQITPYETIVLEDPNAYACQNGVSREGVEGVTACVAQERYLNGEYVDSRLLSSETVTAVVDQVEVVGLLPTPEWWPTGTLIQPVQGIVTSEFGKRRSEHHTGIDIANTLGTSIVAADGGTVLYADWLGNYGYYVVIDHEGLYTCYAHCSKLLVSEGDHVVQGQEIALMGSTGRSTGSHCHFEIHTGEDFADPRDYIDFVETQRG